MTIHSHSKPIFQQFRLRAASSLYILCQYISYSKINVWNVIIAVIAMIIQVDYEHKLSFQLVGFHKPAELPPFFFLLKNCAQIHNIKFKCSSKII